MKIKLFALPVAAFLVYQLAATAADKSGSSSNVKAVEQSSPTIRLLRPIRGEHFNDFPIFVEAEVTGFHLVPPEKQHSKTAPANTGYIAYSMDDLPVYGTDDTQLMIGKFLGERYLPVGWHVVKAELVDVNSNPLNPPVFVVTSVFTGHSALLETDHAEKGSLQAELNAQELYKMRQHLEELEKELLRIKTGNTGFSPTPATGEQQGGE